LPPPEKSDAAIANNPAWPKDPDVQRAKEEAARERNSIRSASDQILHDESRLSDKALTPGAKPGDKRRMARRSGGLAGSSSENIGSPLSAKELGYKGGFFSNVFGGGRDEDVVQFTGEPPRTSLVEPPPGYQTPSPDQPYGLSGKTTAPKAEDYLTTHFEDKK
jgi:hypothetical protein